MKYEIWQRLAVFSAVLLAFAAQGSFAQERPASLTITGQGYGPVRIIESDGRETVLRYTEIPPLNLIKGYLPPIPAAPPGPAEAPAPEAGAPGQPASPEQPVASAPKREDEGLTEEQQRRLREAIGADLQRQYTPQLPETVLERDRRRTSVTDRGGGRAFQPTTSQPPALSERELQLQRRLQEALIRQNTPTLPQNNRPRAFTRPRPNTPSPAAPSPTQEQQFQRELQRDLSGNVVPQLPDSMKRRMERGKDRAVPREGSPKSGPVVIPPHLWKP